MIAGRLDRTISVLRKSIILSDSGEPVETWTPVIRVVAASRVPVSGDERFGGAQYVAMEQTEFRMRWRPDLADLSPLDRIVEPALSLNEAGTWPPDLLLEETVTDRRQYDIMAVHELGRREGLRILAARRVDQSTIEC